MAATKRPTRVVLLLVLVILLGLGIAAYLVNIPIAWIIGGEVLAVLGLAWRLSQSKRPQPVAENVQESAPKS